VSVRDFIKYSSIAHVTKKGFKSLGQDALHLAEYEGFPAHAAALRKRLTKMGD
jgi:histidinol dehydrogenase